VSIPTTNASCEIGLEVDNELGEAPHLRGAAEPADPLGHAPLIHRA
jgi:hypothetical protein